MPLEYFMCLYQQTVSNSNLGDLPVCHEHRRAVTLNKKNIKAFPEQLADVLISGRFYLNHLQWL